MRRKKNRLQLRFKRLYITNRLSTLHRFLIRIGHVLTIYKTLAVIYTPQKKFMEIFGMKKQQKYLHFIVHFYAFDYLLTMQTIDLIADLWFTQCDFKSSICQSGNLVILTGVPFSFHCKPIKSIKIYDLIKKTIFFFHWSVSIFAT